MSTCPAHVLCMCYCVLANLFCHRIESQFYIIQTLEADAGSKYWTFTRWGRVGVPGQQALKGPFSNPGAAIAEFKSKFLAKTKNRFEDRDNFVKYGGKYQLIEMNYDDDADEHKEAPKGKGKGKGKRDEYPATELHRSVQDFVRLVCNVDMMKRQMVEIGCVAQRCWSWLHCITASSVLAGTTQRRCRWASCRNPLSGKVMR